MHVLMFTLSMILILATLSYAKLESFYQDHIVKQGFENIAFKSEHHDLNEEAKRLYDQTPTKKATQPTAKNGKVGTRKLSLNLLLDEKKRELHPEKLKSTLDLTKKVILSLFKHQDAVQKILDEKPDILDHLFAALIQAIDKLPPKQKIKDIKQFASLELQDEELKNLRYELFKENTYRETSPKKRLKETYSLLDELSLENGKTRLYLASKNLLLAFFDGNEAFVNQLIEKRYTIYKQVKKKQLQKDIAQNEFTQFVLSVYPDINQDLFDFSVTVTDPKKYES